MKKSKKILKIISLALLAYLGIGYFLHLVVFPEYKPDISNYFKPGDEFNSKAEGLRQTVIKQENGKVYCRIEVEPHAEGPPLHIHTKFDEIFIGGDHPLNILVGKEEKILSPGEKMLIPMGTPHKPYNKSDSTVMLTMTENAAFPEEFAVYLSQVYGFIDESEDNMKPPTIIFQMAMFTQYFDSYIGEGPPVIVQKSLYFLLVPLARSLGYKSYYQKYGYKR